MWTQTTWHVALKWAVTLLPVLFIVFAVVSSFLLVVEDGEEFSEGRTAIETPAATFP